MYVLQVDTSSLMYICMYINIFTIPISYTFQSFPILTTNYKFAHFQWNFCKISHLLSPNKGGFMNFVIQEIQWSLVNFHVQPSSVWKCKFHTFHCHLLHISAINPLPQRFFNSFNFTSIHISPLSRIIFLRFHF